MTTNTHRSPWHPVLPGWLWAGLLVAAVVLNGALRLNSLLFPEFGPAARQPGSPAARQGRVPGPGAIPPSEAEIQHLRDRYQDENGWTYLLENDPYRWMRRIENYLNTGGFGTRRSGTIDIDDLKHAPFGGEVEPIYLHYYLGVWFHRLLTLINPRLSLMNSLSWFPVVLSAFMVASLFFLAASLRLSSVASLIASLAAGLSPILLWRSGFARFDTDLYCIIMPCVIIGCLIRSFEQPGGYGTRPCRARCGLLGIAGILVGCYSSLWPIWWLSFYMITAGFIVHEMARALAEKAVTRQGRAPTFPGDGIKPGLPLVIFLVFAYGAVLIVSGPDAVRRSFTEPFTYVFLRQGIAIDDFWPNIGFSIVELQRAGFSDLTQLLGGTNIFYIACLGLLTWVMVNDRGSGVKASRGGMIMMVVWFAFGLGLTAFGKRFIIFIIVPAAMAYGRCWDVVVDITHRLQPAHIKRLGKNIRTLALALTLVLFIAPTVQTAVVPVPVIDDSRMEMLRWIRANTPPRAIVNAYWDYGDFIATIGHRATVYDGSWQYMPAAYWIPRVFMAADEREAVGILRMLDSGANQAFDQLNRIFSGDKLKALALVNTMILSKPDESRVMLAEQKIAGDVIEDIIGSLYRYCGPAYLLLDERLSGFMPAVSRIASWDFQRYESWRKFSEPREIKNRFGLVDKDKLYQWIAPQWLRIFSPARAAKSDTQQELVLFNDTIKYDPRNKTAGIYDKASGQWLDPGVIIIVNGQTITRAANPSGQAGMALLVREFPETCEAVVLDTALLDTLFFKLFYLGGAGLEHFKPVYRAAQPGCATVYLYEIDWGKD